jgi:hypothetical protein
MIHKRKPAALAKQREKDEPINPQEDSPEAAGTQLASFKYDPAVAQPTWPESFLTFVGSNAFPLSGPPAARWLDGCQVLEKGIKLGGERITEAAGESRDSVPGYEYRAGSHVREFYAVPVSRIWQVIKRSLALDESLRFSVRDMLAVSRLNLGECVERFALVNGISPREAADILDRILNGLVPLRVNRPSIHKLGAEAALAQAARISEEKEGQSELF